MISNKSKGKGSIFQKVPSIFSFRKYTLQWGIVLVLVVVIILFIIGSPKAFLSPRLYLAVMATAPFVGIMALGMTFMVISGEIDLSFGSVMGMSGLIFAIIYTMTGSAALASVGALSMGLAAGALNGVLVTKIGIPSFVVTIATMFFWRGLTHVGSGGLPIAFTSAVKATVMADVFVGRVGGVIPAQFLWLVLLSVVLWFILNRHSFGNDVYFVGDNKASAKVVGINVDRTKIFVFALMGLLAGLSGVINNLEMMSWWSTQGEGYLLPVFAIVFVGGNLVTGGRGTIFGTFVATFIMGVLEAGIIASGFGGFWTQVFYGLLIIIAVVLHTIMRRMK